MKIAVCDDRPEHLKKIRELLEKYQQTRPGLESQAEYFLSGAELLDQAEERGGYDLYLLDILMPGENGISVGKRLRQTVMRSGPFSICSSRWRRKSCSGCWIRRWNS